MYTPAIGKSLLLGRSSSDFTCQLVICHCLNFSTSYPDAIQLLTKLLQSTHTNSLLTSTQKMLQHNLPLGSYLLKPVQRILKYHLLLDVCFGRDKPPISYKHITIVLK